MSGRVAGLEPWLPWPLSRWRWWTEPVRAERLAALRIGIAFVLLLDWLFLYLPHLHDFFGRDSLGDSILFGHLWEDHNWKWSIFHGVKDPHFLNWFMTVAICATFTLMIGFCTRASAVVVWVLSVSFGYANTFIDNAGDEVRTIALFYLMIGRSGAAWSVDSLLARWRGTRKGPA